MGEPRTRQALLDAIRDETREAVIEGDRNDCTSPDCVADAVYEIVRVALLREDEARPSTGDPARDFVYWFMEQPHHRQRAFIVDWLRDPRHMDPGLRAEFPDVLASLSREGLRQRLQRFADRIDAGESPNDAAGLEWHDLAADIHEAVGGPAQSGPAGSAPSTAASPAREGLRQRIEALPRYALLPSLDALPYIGLDDDGPFLSRNAVLAALSAQPLPVPRDEPRTLGALTERELRAADAADADAHELAGGRPHD